MLNELTCRYSCTIVEFVSIIRWKFPYKQRSITSDNWECFYRVYGKLRCIWLCIRMFSACDPLCTVNDIHERLLTSFRSYLLYRMLPSITISLTFFLLDTCFNPISKPSSVVSWSQISLLNSIAVFETVRSYQLNKKTCLYLWGSW